MDPEARTAGGRQADKAQTLSPALPVASVAET
jgi:hypothetical protein